MQYEEAFDLARTNLSHQTRAFEVLRNVIHTTIMFGVASSSALIAYSVTKMEEGVWWAGVSSMIFGLYVGIVTAYFAFHEYRSMSSPAEGVEPNILMSEKARNRTRDQFFENEMSRIQHKIDRYQIINARRGRNLNRLVGFLVASPLVLLPSAILGFLLSHLC